MNNRKSISFLLWVTLGIHFITGCQQAGKTHGSAGKLSSRGSSLGLIQWESIPAAESKISFKDKDELVRARREKIEAHRNLHSQAFRLPGGSLLYEKRESIPYEVEIFTPREEIIKRYANHPELLAQNLIISDNKIESSEVSGDFNHIVVTSSSKKCFLFFGYSSDSDLQRKSRKDSPHYQAVTGSLCVEPSSKKAESLEKDMLGLLNSILFDDGEYTRKQLLAKAFKKLDVIEEERLREAAQDTKGPDIQITDQIEADDNDVVLTGRITDGSVIDMVRVNNTWVSLLADGSFSVKLAVSPDTESLSLVAIDKYGNTTEKDIKVVRKGVPEKVAEVPGEVDYGSFYALMIGNNEYEHWRDLETPHYDVYGLEEALANFYNFKTHKRIVDASYEDILDALDELRFKIYENDNLFIYYSGHGVLHKGKGYWVPSDGYLDDPKKWIANSEINRALRRLPAKHVIVVADSCYSGTLTQGKIEKVQQQYMGTRSRTAMSAGSGDEVVLEPVLDPGQKDNSVFAKKLIKVLKTNTEDVRDGYSIFEEVKSLLSMYPQHPQYGSLHGVGHEEGGDFYFIKGTH